ncbi:MAG: hypothetical protein OEU26_04580 [Candidatus Tectomicrobia bacterium]|nr:hypothetical protein [Candidatus Tectomicrobia bacterium]
MNCHRPSCNRKKRMRHLSTAAPKLDTRPEAELLVGCARLLLDADHADHAARLRTVLQHDLDWAYLIELA